MAGDLSRISVLVVDDNIHMIHIVRSLLRGFGIVDIHETRDSGEALEITRMEPIDIVILDYQMDLLDGIEFTQMVRTAQDSRNKLVPIILLTAYTERSRIIAARDAGVTEVCRKPVTPHELYTKIASVINNPRPFVRSKTFFGPDRRRHTGVNYRGEERRASEQDVDEVSADQAE